MTVVVFRIRDGSSPSWLLVYRTTALPGTRGEALGSLLSRWTRKHGKPTGTLRIRGDCTLSEAVATMAWHVDEECD